MIEGPFGKSRTAICSESRGLNLRHKHYTREGERRTDSFAMEFRTGTLEMLGYAEVS